MKSSLFTTLLLFAGLVAGDAAAAGADGAALENRFLSVGIDNVTIETEGLTRASLRLAESVDRLALALQQLSSGSEALSEADRRVLLKAVESVDRAGSALARLADELPQSARQLSEQLPLVVENARQPIADLSSGLQSARDGMYAITESLPQATENAKALVDSALDSALVKISTYSIILIATLALALIAVFWFIYRQYLAPIAAGLEPLAAAPGHFADLARYMKETSDNLLTLRAGAEDSAATQPGSESPTAEQREPMPRANTDAAGNKSE